MHWDYWRLLSIVTLAGFVGMLFGQMMTFMFIAAFIYALWLQRSWYQLWFWLLKPKKNPSPSSEGVIDDVCRQIDLMRLQNRSRKKKLTGYLKRFQAATAALPDAVVVIGEYGQVDWANSAARTFLGIHWPHDKHVRLNNLIRDPAFQTLLEAPAGHVGTVVSPINAAMQLEMKIVNYMGDGRLLIARDMTQTVKLQKMRRDFVANVSHELRTPLTVLRGYLGTFSEHSPQQQWQSALPIMRQQADRMHHMISDLLALSRLETGEKVLHHEPINIPSLLASIVEDGKRLEHYCDHDITLVVNSDDWLLGDEGEIRSAISNLVFNAIKYTPPHCRIVLHWTVEGKTAKIKVIDQGDGIAEHHIDRLTERFYRVDSGRAQEAGGTGLGLSIVKHVLQRHDAELEINSDIGAGAEFCCCFPKNRLIKKRDVVTADI